MLTASPEPPSPSGSWFDTLSPQPRPGWGWGDAAHQTQAWSPPSPSPPPRPACPTFSPTSEPPVVLAGLPQLPERQLQGGSPNSPRSAPHQPKSWNPFPAATNSHTPLRRPLLPSLSTFPKGSPIHLLPLSALPAPPPLCFPSSHPRTAGGPRWTRQLRLPRGCSRHNQTSTPPHTDTRRNRQMPSTPTGWRPGWHAPHRLGRPRTQRPLAATPARCQGRTQRARGQHPPTSPQEPLGPLPILPATWRALGRARPRLPPLELRGGAGRAVDGSSGVAGLGAGPAPVPAAAASVLAEAAGPTRGLEPGERGPRERGAALRWSSARRALGPGNHQVWTPRTPCAAEAPAQPPPAAHRCG